MKIPGAIIAASDCRITGTEITNQIENKAKGDKADGNTNPVEKYNYIKTDNEQKTFLLLNRFNKAFSISYCGNACIGVLPTSFCITNALKRLQDVNSTNEIAEYFKFLWSGIPNSPNLLIGGYNDNQASIIELRSNGIIKTFYEQNNDFGFVYSGEQKLIEIFLNNFNFEIKSFRLQDAIKFCAFLITTTARMQAFQNIQQTVSSKYDLLVITENKSKWIVQNSNELI